MTVPKQGSKFDMRVNPVYQVDWMHQAVGKRMAATKRCIRFRFGFSDAAALQAGEAGPSCRGEEHDVLLVWSLTSGKKIVTMDGREVHFSCGGKFSQNHFETSWSLGCHTIKIIAHAAPPMFKVPGFKQFDLQLDGLSFFQFAKLYELRMKNGIQSDNLAVPRITGKNKASNSGELSSSEKGFAKRTTLETHLVATSHPGLVSSSKPSYLPAHPVVDMLSSKPPAQQDFLDSGTSEVNLSSTDDKFAPQIAAPYTFAMTSNQIMSAYAPAPAMLALSNESHAYGFHVANEPALVAPQTYCQASPHSNFYQPPKQKDHFGQQQRHPMQNEQPFQQESYYFLQQKNASSPSTHDMNSNKSATFAHPVVLSMQPLSISDTGNREQAPEMLSPLEKAFRSLVQLDDINEAVETPEQRKYLQQKVVKQGVHSKPLPPTKADWTLDSQARLGDIKRNAAPKAETKREIMRTHAYDPTTVQAGMMVVYDPADVRSQQYGLERRQQYHQQYYPPHQQHVGFYPQQHAQRMY